MAEEIDKFEMDYFRAQDERREREYKREKRERLEREREEAQHFVNEQSEEEEVCDGIIDPIGDLPPEIEAYIESDEFSKTVSDLSESHNSSDKQYEPVHDKENALQESKEEQVEDLEYELKEAVLKLDEAVKFSRKRAAKNPELTLHTDDRYDTMEDISDENHSEMYRDESIMTIYHELSYPEDYTWTQGYRTFDELPIQEGCTKGWDDEELEDNHVAPEDIDIDVECEVNFQKALESVKECLGRFTRDKITRADISLKIPYTQRYRATMYEIRLIDFMIRHGVQPRVSLCICRENKVMAYRSLLSMTILWYARPKNEFFG